MTTVVIAGIGYAGLPLAMHAAQAGHRVIGDDTDPSRVKLLEAGESYIEDVPSKQLMRALEGGAFRPSSDPRACAGFDVAVIVPAADPHVVRASAIDAVVARVEPTRAEISSANVVVLLTDHDAFDVGAVSEHARYVLDRRHVAVSETVETL
jgi:UDP-N-acetyl-D-mannosaminuronate dehydrogenase